MFAGCEEKRMPRTDGVGYGNDDDADYCDDDEASSESRPLATQRATSPRQTTEEGIRLGQTSGENARDGRGIRLHANGARSQDALELPARRVGGVIGVGRGRCSSSSLCCGVGGARATRRSWFHGFGRRHRENKESEESASRTRHGQISDVADDSG